MRVVSLLPSATEILWAIGAGDLLVGRSHECDFPASIAHMPALTRQRTTASTSADIDREVRETLGPGGAGGPGGQGGAAAASLYTLDTDLLRSLRPDVILTQDLCEVCSIDLDTVRAAVADMTPRPEICSLDPAGIEDLFDDVLRVGDAVGREAEAHEAMIALRDRYWTAVDYVNPYVDGPEVAFLEWMDPLFAGGHWTPQLIAAAGGRHPLNPPGAKSIEISEAALVHAVPERIIVCPCGFDLAAIERESAALTARSCWPDLPAVRAGHVVMVDGNQMFNRPGPRLVDAFRWLVGWLNDRPELIPADFPARPFA